MATYKEIQQYVKDTYGFKPKTCWIADVKEQSGMPMRVAWNRQGSQRTNPCPQDKVEFIRKGLEHFELI